MGLILPSLGLYLHIADTVHLEYLVSLGGNLIAPYRLLSCSKGKRLHCPVLDFSAAG